MLNSTDAAACPSACATASSSAAAWVTRVWGSAALIGADYAVQEAIEPGLDLWTDVGHPGPANAAASALAADLSGEPWRHYHGPVVVCGVELGEAGEEYAVDLTGDRLAALRRRLGRHSAE